MAHFVAETNDDSGDSDGLSTGALAGIIVGCVVGLIIVLLVVVMALFYISKQSGSTSKVCNAVRLLLLAQKFHFFKVLEVNSENFILE